MHPERIIRPAFGGTCSFVDARERRWLRHKAVSHPPQAIASFNLGPAIDACLPFSTAIGHSTWQVYCGKAGKLVLYRMHSPFAVPWDLSKLEFPPL
jgi:hypothetical protein